MCTTPEDDQWREREDDGTGFTPLPDLDELFEKSGACWADDDDEDELSGDLESGRGGFVEWDCWYHY